MKVILLWELRKKIFNVVAVHEAYALIIGLSLDINLPPLPIWHNFWCSRLHGGSKTFTP